MTSRRCKFSLDYDVTLTQLFSTLGIDLSKVDTDSVKIEFGLDYSDCYYEGDTPGIYITITE